MYFSKEVKAVIKKITKNATTSRRAQLEHPYKDGGHVVATDGHRLIRLTTNPDEADGHYTIDGHKVELGLDYPDWRMVVPDDGTIFQVDKAQFNSLPKKLAGPVGGHGWVTLRIEDGNDLRRVTINLGYLIDALGTLDSTFYVSLCRSDYDPVKLMNTDRDTDDTQLCWVLMPIREPSNGLVLDVTGVKVSQ